MSQNVLISGQPRIFRSVNAGIIYDKSELDKLTLKYIERRFEEINVKLIPSEKVLELQDDFGILGLLGSRAVTRSRQHLEAISCLKIGFYPDSGTMQSLAKSLRHLSASVVCHGSKTMSEALANTVFHFYESLTLPSLLNIDLADVESIAAGIGVSFNETGDSSEEIIEKLPPESFDAKSALMHFSCVKNVTLEEVYSITKTISARKLTYLERTYPQPNEKKLYKPTKLKMGLRIIENPARNKPRISLTAILFGIKS
ncbi:MAG: hypothetical protein OK439_05895 [Thaumarchaeota archaeon]|nr:hypothetical protein [Nitrososphaerota archaeon]